MDFNELKKLAEAQKSIVDGLNSHAEELIKEHKKDVDSLMPNFFNDVSKMIKNNNLKGVSNKIKEVIDASKHPDNKPEGI